MITHKDENRFTANLTRDWLINDSSWFYFATGASTGISLETGTNGCGLAEGLDICVSKQRPFKWLTVRV